MESQTGILDQRVMPEIENQPCTQKNDDRVTQEIENPKESQKKSRPKISTRRYPTRERKPPQRFY